MIRHVSTNSAQLAVHEWGAGPRSIVALHPGMGDHRIWNACAGVWADAGHHVVAYGRARPSR